MSQDGGEALKLKIDRTVSSSLRRISMYSTTCYAVMSDITCDMRSRNRCAERFFSIKIDFSRWFTRYVPAMLFASIATVLRAVLADSRTKGTRTTTTAKCSAFPGVDTLWDREINDLPYGAAWIARDLYEGLGDATRREKSAAGPARHVLDVVLNRGFRGAVA